MSASTPQVLPNNVYGINSPRLYMLSRTAAVRALPLTGRRGERRRGGRDMPGLPLRPRRVLLPLREAPPAPPIILRLLLMLFPELKPKGRRTCASVGSSMADPFNVRLDRRGKSYRRSDAWIPLFCGRIARCNGGRTRCGRRGRTRRQHLARVPSLLGRRIGRRREVGHRR